MSAMLDRMVDWRIGRDALVSFRTAYPDSQFVPEALFWEGESYLGPCGTPRFTERASWASQQGETR